MAYFRFPPGATSVSVEQQTFVPTFTKNVRGADRKMIEENYCAAPDHFSVKLIEAGFAMVDRPSEAPSDTATEDMLANDSIRELGLHIDALRQENVDLRETIKQMQTDFLALKTENEGLKEELGQKTGPLPEPLNAIDPDEEIGGEVDNGEGAGSDTGIAPTPGSITGLKPVVKTGK